MIVAWSVALAEAVRVICLDEPGALRSGLPGGGLRHCWHSGPVHDRPGLYTKSVDRSGWDLSFCSPAQRDRELGCLARAIIDPRQPSNRG
jgi:hypothetical protein